MRSHEFEVSKHGLRAACSLLGLGTLIGGHDRSGRFTDSRTGDPRFMREGFSRNVNLVQCLTDVARRAGCTVWQPALCWVIQQTGVQRISRVAENAAAGVPTLPPEVTEEVNRILAQQA